MIRNFIFLVSFTLFVQGLVGQTDDPVQIYSPNAYALARYGDIPVDYSTGVPDISIPLMSISDKDISVDISLSYHATGIRVDQEATWVGLGWVLNAGGIITSQARGKQDKYSTFTNKFNSRPDIHDTDSIYPPSTYINTLKQELDDVLYPSGSDGEPDIFYYNFCGKTGKFVLDNNAKACFFKYEDFKVEVTKVSNINSGSINFTIIDNSGIRYEFTPFDSYFTNDNGEERNDCWYLTKITSPSGGEINFEYNNNYSEYAIARMYSTCFVEVYPFDLKTHSIDYMQYHGSMLSNTMRDYSLLSKITTQSGHVDFKLSATGRKDKSPNSNKRALEEIELYNNGNEVQKKIKLEYGYFEASSNRQYKTIINTTSPEYDYLNYRLRLESMKELSAAGEKETTFSFEYYDTEDVYTLPYRLSPSQDHWGYCNNSDNTVIFPNNPAYRVINPEPGWDWYCHRGGPIFLDYPKPFESASLAGYEVTNGANREPDTEAVKAATLKKITYPTGGYTQFEFEPNRSQNDKQIAGIRINKITSSDGNGCNVVKEYTYTPFWGPYCEYYVNDWISPYHTLYYDPYSDDFATQSAIYYQMMAVGIPPNMAWRPKARVIKIEGLSQLKLGGEMQPYYTKVAEKITGEGLTEYTYSCMDDFFDNEVIDITINNTSITDAFTFACMYTILSFMENYSIPPYYFKTTLSFNACPYPEPISNDWQSRLLTNKKVYREDRALIAEDSIYYRVETQQAIHGYKVLKLGEYEYMYARYYTTVGLVKTNREVNIQYIPGQGKAYKVTEYDYTSSSHKQVTESRTWNSTGKLITDKYYYPPEYGNTLATLRDKNILLPVDSRTYKGSRLISGVQMKYNERGQPEIKYGFDADVDDIPFDAGNPYTFTPKASFSYNSNFNLRTFTPESYITTVYLWGYKDQYPIAKIENATFDQVKSALGSQGQAIIDRIAGANIPSSSDLALIDNLRFSANLKDALITTYTYKPLIGMQTMTDPRGVITNYDYDPFGRLQKVTQAGKVIESYDYHYKN